MLMATASENENKQALESIWKILFNALPTVNLNDSNPSHKGNTKLPLGT